MKALIKIEMSRAFCSKRFLIPLCIGLGLAVWQMIESAVNAAQYQYLVTHNWHDLPHSVFNHTFGLDGNITLSGTIFFFILPILAALPFADSYYADLKSGYVKNVFIRAPKIHYYTAKALAVFLSAATVVFIPLIVNLLGTMMILPAVMPDCTGTFVPFSISLWSGIFYTNPYLYCLLYFLLIAVFAGLFALVAPTMTRFLRGRFPVLVSPFALCFFSTTLLGLTGPYQWNPQTFLRPGGGLGTTTPILLIEMLILLLPCVFLFFIRGLRDDTF